MYSLDLISYREESKGDCGTITRLTRVHPPTTKKKNQPVILPTEALPIILGGSARKGYPFEAGGILK